MIKRARASDIAKPETVHESRSALMISSPIMSAPVAHQPSGESTVGDDALIAAEIDRLLGKARAMAQYFGLGAVENAIGLACRINRMNLDGQHTGQGGKAQSQQPLPTR